MKYSRQRETILQIIRDSDEHPTADMIHKEAQKTLPHISLGTVYRNLKALEEHDIIRHVEVPHHKDHFDKTLEEHYHLYCVKCKRMFDIPNVSLQDIDREVTFDTGFKVISHQSLFSGYCHDCERKENYGIKRK